MYSTFLKLSHQVQFISSIFKLLLIFVHFGYMLTGNCKTVLLRFALAGLEKVMRESACCGPFRSEQRSVLEVSP